MNIGEKIKSRRTELGLTFEEVGNMVGVGKSTVRKWETGDIKDMRRDKVSKLAYALKVSPSYLMGWTDSPYEDPAAAPTRASVAAKLEGFLRQAGYLNADEPLTPELLSSISVALETAIEIYRKNHQ